MQRPGNGHFQETIHSQPMCLKFSVQEKEIQGEGGEEGKVQVTWHPKAHGKEFGFSREQWAAASPMSWV